MDRVRVVMVTTWFPTAGDPVAGTFVRKDAELIATHHDVEVIHLIPPARATESEEVSGLSITRVPMSTSDPRDILRAWPRIAERLAGADVLHTQAFSTLLPFAGRRVPIPWVHSEHWSGVADPAGLTLRGRLVLSATGRLLRRPHVVTTVSGFLGDRVRRFRPRGAIEIVPSVVPAAHVVPPPHDPALLRLVSVGGLVPGKDPRLALEVTRELRRRGTASTLTWVGDGPLRGDLERELTPADRVEFTGAVDAAGVAAALDRADVFLLPTRGETLCLSALEAISHGRPVVMGDRGGQREYVTAANGRLVQPRTAAAYADAIQDIWAPDDPAAPDAVAATIGDRFHAEAVLAGYERAYARARGAYGILSAPE